MPENPYQNDPLADRLRAFGQQASDVEMPLLPPDEIRRGGDRRRRRKQVAAAGGTLAAALVIGGLVVQNGLGGNGAQRDLPGGTVTVTQSASPPSTASPNTASTASTSSGAPSPSSSTGTSGAPSSAATASIEVPVGEAAGFMSPSGNIVCLLTSSPTDNQVLCDALAHDWTVKAADKATNCVMDGGSRLFLQAGRVGFACQPDLLVGAALDSGDPKNPNVNLWHAGKPGTEWITVAAGRALALSYGTRITSGPITCAMARDGVHCQDTTTSRGFDLSRQAYTLR